MGVNEFNVNPVDWVLLSPGIETRSEAVQWAERGCTWPDSPTPVKADAVPSIIRRRISSLSKLGLQAALTLSENRHVDYAVFSSRHGELTRSTGLIREILSGADASPTAFSQSVHNTTAGLFTIIGKRPVPVTSLAAGHDGFHEALIDIHAYLVQHPDHTVLMIDFDEALPEPYRVYDSMPYPGHALGLLLESGPQWTCRGTRTDGEANPLMPQALEFLRAHLSGAIRWECVSPRYRWQWTRKPS